MLIQRNPKFEYQEYGRNQSLEEAKEKDQKLEKLINDRKIKVFKVIAGENAVFDTLQHLGIK